MAQHKTTKMHME